MATVAVQIDVVERELQQLQTEVEGLEDRRAAASNSEVVASLAAKITATRATIASKRQRLGELRADNRQNAFVSIVIVFIVMIVFFRPQLIHAWNALCDAAVATAIDAPLPDGIRTPPPGSN
eukprot:Amastigsp_a1829_428.p3 type:complete len:122 gc:universal Amastigsp_a1829_428:892-527(-)